MSNNVNNNFTIQKIYLKDVSFESPNVPQVFNNDWEPEVAIDLDNKAAQVEETLYTVDLRITAKIKAKDTIAFVVEVTQSGLFIISNFPEEQKKHILGSACPEILFPYAREAISDIVTKGGFPPLLLAPVNFEMLYRQYLTKEQKAVSNASE